MRAEADRELAPYRRKMPAAQIDQLQKQYIHKKLLEKYRLAPVEFVLHVTARVGRTLLSAAFDLVDGMAKTEVIRNQPQP